MMRMLFGRGASRTKDDEVGNIAVADPVAAVNLADAIQRNKEAIDTLEKRQQHIERKIRVRTERLPEGGFYRRVCRFGCLGPAFRETDLTHIVKESGRKNLVRFA